MVYWLSIAKNRRSFVLSHDARTLDQKAVELQRAYYAETADQYDQMHVRENDEHGFALNFLCSVIQMLGIESVLDVGCGTGRGLLAIKQVNPALRVLGVEPSKELRRVGHSNGLSERELIDGDAMSLSLQNNSFDLVCEFGALHHIPRPSQAVSEMLRVGNKAIFISDSNNFGQGSSLSRMMKQLFNSLGLWPVANFVKTRGKGYSISVGDGLGYSYSVFNDLRQIQRNCQSVHFLNTLNAGPNLYRTAPHIALLGIKRHK